MNVFIGNGWSNPVRTWIWNWIVVYGGDNMHPYFGIPMTLNLMVWKRTKFWGQLMPEYAHKIKVNGLQKCANPKNKYVQQQWKYRTDGRMSDVSASSGIHMPIINPNIEKIDAFSSV